MKDNTKSVSLTKKEGLGVFVWRDERYSWSNMVLRYLVINEIDSYGNSCLFKLHHILFLENGFLCTWDKRTNPFSDQGNSQRFFFFN